MDRTPNILYIMVDQQRYDCLGFSQKYPVKTPHLDQLAAEGVVFSNAYTHIPLCCPARQSFLHGRRPETFGALWNYDLGLKTLTLDPKAYAWPRELKKKDYQTAYLGKWHVHPICDPTHFGYDDYVSEADYANYRTQKYPEYKYMDGIKIEESDSLSSWFGSPDPVPLEDTRTHWLAQKAMKTIERYAKSRKPWHINLEFTEPHLPYRPNEKFVQRYRPETLQKWGSFQETFVNKPYIQRQQLVSWGIEGFTWEEWAPIVAHYYAMISQVDEAIGQVLQTVKRLGLEEDTVIIFTSDHGDMCGAHRMIDKHYVLYDDVVKVPLIVKAPKSFKGGVMCEAFIYNLLDISPTILELCGIEPPAIHQGRSLVPLLKGEKISDWRKEVVSTYNGQQFGLYTQRMIRTADWKYIWNTTDVDEFYDLKEDPNELNNAIDDERYLPIIQQLRTRLYTILLEEGDTLVDNHWMKAQLIEGRKL
ncbi:arylsulfatase A-like enzyme [Pullulanibacillus pueri]|uniref:Acetylglucosamine-6-sulfatase n=1 Tax=Pullulanibacillus pueri TaxID=1437324 RepID=A0A8J2ZY66_9BACL|nr:sulfatase-like hydrolase/transferase [Pullulanibacillus pueri]MBM7683320.1 arylsulfatase A-like enzyme [Pullulanibacillus pueri]GGH86403.1 acetylglucosamine-6-sulfatase [Pullulanibacillus pueri]